MYILFVLTIIRLAKLNKFFPFLVILYENVAFKLQSDVEIKRRTIKTYLSSFPCNFHTVAIIRTGKNYSSQRG